MKNYWFYVLGIFVVVAACRKENNSTSNIDEFLIRGNKYVLNWSDEFEYNGLPDSTKWSYETGYVRNNSTSIHFKDWKMIWN